MPNDQTIVLSVFGTQGDILPMLRLAVALKARGHRPVMMVNPTICPQIASAGVQSIGVGEPTDVNQLIADNPKYMGRRGGEHVLKDLYIPFAGQLFHQTMEAIHRFGPSAIVSHAGSFGATWAAWQAHLPLAIVHMAPTSLISCGSRRGLPAWKRLAYRLLAPAMTRMANRWMAPVRHRLGLPQGRGMFLSSLLQADRVLGLWSPLLRPADSTDPSGARICGFTQPGLATTSLDGRIERFLQTGPPPVAFCLGSSAVNIAGDFYTEATKACDLLGCRGLLLCGDSIPKDVGPKVLAAPQAPFASVFPHCQAVVHHGGIGTCSDCLHAGIPSVVVPFGHDQFDNADRLAALGVATKLLRRRARAATLAKAIRHILDPSRTSRSADIRNSLAAEPDGARIAAAEIGCIIGNG